MRSLDCAPGVLQCKGRRVRPASGRAPSHAAATADADMGEPYWGCDTLDQIARDCAPAELTLEYLNEALFAPLATMAGIVVQGKASPVFCTEEPWGSPMALPTGETLHLRTYPPRLVAMLRSGYRPMVVIVAVRRVGTPSAADDVAFAMCWDDSVALKRALHVGTQTPRPPKLSDASQGTRQLHIMVPSLFRHHEPSAMRTGAQTRWPSHDCQLYHRVPAKSFSVRRHTETGPRSVPSAGFSKWILAGDFVQVDVEHAEMRPAQLIEEVEWCERCRTLVNSLYNGARQNGLSTTEVESAAANASLVCDMLTAESIVGMLGEPVLDGAWPDLLHMPSGFPLLVAFAIRIACYPERYKLPAPTAGDKWANDQIVSIFEASWEPLPPHAGAGGGVGDQYAIDLVIARAWTQAVAQAKGVLGRSVAADLAAAPRDQLRFWQRAGQRCAVEIFGASRLDFDWPKPPFGQCNTLDDPLNEARRRVLRKTLSAGDAMADGVYLPFGHQTTRMKRQTLMHVLNSVEQWLRSGFYSGHRLKHERRRSATPPSVPSASAPSPAPAAPAAPATRATRATRATGPSPAAPLELHASTTAGEVRLFVRAALEEHIQTRLQSDPSVSARGAELLRKRVVARLEDFLHHATDATRVNLLPTDADLQSWLDCPTVDAGGTSAASVGVGGGGGGSDGAEGAASAAPPFSIDDEALDAAVETLRDAINYGSLALHDYNLNVHVNHGNAHNQCADCGATVHVLQAAFLNSETGTCVSCHRARCLKCAREASDASFKGASQRTTCKRCKMVSKAMRKDQRHK